MNFTFNVEYFAFALQNEITDPIKWDAHLRDLEQGFQCSLTPTSLSDTSQSNLLQSQAHDKDNNIPLVITYSPKLEYRHPQLLAALNLK